jgi:hypothetical protein
MHLLSWEVLDGHEHGLKIRLERDAEVTKYAILSHRWGRPEDEVSFEDMLSGRPEKKKGYMKLVGCCRRAQRDGLRHVWIDTCCINKSSSAELSETITSMFTYYERSEVCYVYLEDVWTEFSISSTFSDNHQSSFSQSAWFTRGWTLQELIAPHRVEFFDRSWNFLGLKTDERLCSMIERVTGIDSVVLTLPATTQLISISKRMSWAARRKTTRVEDMAYSLMGIFGVYMPPLYGEGNHAFIRLQEQIMRTSNDHTIFAWTSSPKSPLSHGFEHVSTMLALSPDQFERSSNFKPLSHIEHNKALVPGGQKLDYAVTNAGLSIRLPLLPIDEVDGLYAAFLACAEGQDQVPAAILLRTTAETPPGHFWRTNMSGGPIERSESSWFPNLGRDAIDPTDIYILPRFTSISKDNFEPSWNRIDITEMQNKSAGKALSSTKKHSFGIDTKVLNDLNHVADPYFRQLAYYRRMISTSQGDKLVSLVKNKLRPPKTIPFPRNNNFHGRADVLHSLRNAFFPSDIASRSQGKGTTSCAICGLGGMGKTQVAVEFSYDCLERHLFDAVIWIDAQNIETIQSGFQRIATELGLVEQGSSVEAAVREVFVWLSDFDEHSTFLGANTSHSAKWLLVFDNVDDASFLTPLWPSSESGCVLMTSRKSNAWFAFASENISLEPFTMQESSELFRKLTRTTWDFSEISRRCDGLPLAITHNADYIASKQLTIEEYITLWDEGVPKELNHHPSHSSNGHSVNSILSVAIDQLSPSGHGLLKVISILNPDLIQGWIFNPSRTAALELAEFPGTTRDFLESRTELILASLLRKHHSRNGLEIHRFVQHFVRNDMDPLEFQKALATAVVLLSSAWTCAISDEQDESTNSRLVDLLPHVFKLKDFSSEMIDSEDAFSTKKEFEKLLGHAEEFDALVGNSISLKKHKGHS